eukprot:800707-Rhodomonas_salina.1
MSSRAALRGPFLLLSASSVPARTHRVSFEACRSVPQGNEHLRMQLDVRPCDASRGGSAQHSSAAV